MMLMGLENHRGTAVKKMTGFQRPEAFGGSRAEPWLLSFPFPTAATSVPFLTALLPQIAHSRKAKAGWALPMSLLLHGLVLLGLLPALTSPPPPEPPAPQVIELQMLAPEPPPPEPAEPAPPAAPSPPTHAAAMPSPHPKPAPSHKPAAADMTPSPEPPSSSSSAQTEAATVTPAVPSAPSAAPPQPSAPPASYIGQIRARLERIKRYPAEARYDGAEGTVQLRFLLDRSGNLLSWSVLQSSGVAALDEEVGRMIRQATPFPAFPDTLEQDRLELVIPVNFSLKMRVN